MNNDEKKIQKLNSLKTKYITHEKLIIARYARKTLRYIEIKPTTIPLALDDG